MPLLLNSKQYDGNQKLNYLTINACLCMGAIYGGLMTRVLKNYALHGKYVVEDY